MMVDPKSIRWDEKAAFKAELSKKPYEIYGIYPSSMDRRLRTDIIIALIKEGFVRYDHFDQGIKMKVLRPFIIQGHLYHPDPDVACVLSKQIGVHLGQCPAGNIKLTYVDWDRVDKVFGKELSSDN